MTTAESSKENEGEPNVAEDEEEEEEEEDDEEELSDPKEKLEAGESFPSPPPGLPGNEEEDG